MKNATLFKKRSENGHIDGVCLAISNYTIKALETLADASICTILMQPQIFGSSARHPASASQLPDLEQFYGSGERRFLGRETSIGVYVV
ncbi:MAG: hypothetical protein P4L44_01700 [Oryzomonas sp.]|uniref:hypothetical protein n=1 Tax=Oryzomonas sp. TaxID=2855186 RepID=UPI00285116DA|nr:hypothetical protein [Oryzomonas sp.]MDR3578657.1 hypothetical protein [Oryzomonas sp.]